MRFIRNVNEESLHKCPECGKTFSNKSILTQHIEAHSFQHQCSYCDSNLSSKYNLKLHIIRRHIGDKNFSCNICDKKFIRKADLEIHTRMHTGAKPYQCTVCKKSFSQLTNLNSHIRDTHDKVRRYKCAICQEGFKRKRLVNYHMLAKHKMGELLKCPGCEKEFIYPQQLKKHKEDCVDLREYIDESSKLGVIDNGNGEMFVHYENGEYAYYQIQRVEDNSTEESVENDALTPNSDSTFQE